MLACCSGLGISISLVMYCLCCGDNLYTISIQVLFGSEFVHWWWQLKGQSVAPLIFRTWVRIPLEAGQLSNNFSLTSTSADQDIGCSLNCKFWISDKRVEKGYFVLECGSGQSTFLKQNSSLAPGLQNIPGRAGYPCQYIIQLSLMISTNFAA